MLKLENINKDYILDKKKYKILKNISIEFNINEFVSILGPSGSGKTTLLNIIGGLDKATSGNIYINGKNTNNFSQHKWDAYRNNVIGFVFQSYNLINHLTALENVMLALKLSGKNRKDQIEKAKLALEKVGLENQINKKPSQLSGGQIQRVAIARAIVNNPKVLLADEPTGALDSETGKQIMQLIKSLSSDMLVIMVTHNQDLAKLYSNRIIEMKDGEIIIDSKKEPEGNKTSTKFTIKKSSMPFSSALALSGKNLLTKKGRSILTIISSSIAILSLALVLALNIGMSSFTNNLQQTVLASYPLQVQQFAFNIASNFFSSESGDFPTGDKVIPYTPESEFEYHKNSIDNAFAKYMSKLETRKNLFLSYNKIYGNNINLITKNNNKYYLLENKKDCETIGGFSENFYQMPDYDFMYQNYKPLIGRIPKKNNEVALVVDANNEISTKVLQDFGFNASSYKFSDFLNKPIAKVIFNDDFYTQSIDQNNHYVFTPKSENEYKTLYDNSNYDLKIVGILRIKQEKYNPNMNNGVYSSGFFYTQNLADDIYKHEKNSIVAQKQATADYCIFSNLYLINDELFEPTSWGMNCLRLDDLKRYACCDNIAPSGYIIYPKDFNSKETILNYINSYQNNKGEKVEPVDISQQFISLFNEMISIITIVLLVFAVISIIVSALMISIITYVSVVERTKEIGILRSIGARGKDILRIFNSETIIIGFFGGLLGTILAFIATIPLNIIIKNYIKMNVETSIAKLPIYVGLGLIIISMLISLLSGFIPSRLASKKNPVQALKTE